MPRKVQRSRPVITPSHDIGIGRCGRWVKYDTTWRFAFEQSSFPYHAILAEQHSVRLQCFLRFPSELTFSDCTIPNAPVAPVPHVPPSQHDNAVTTDQRPAGRTPCKRILDLAQFTQGVQALSTVRFAMGIPDEYLSITLTPATTYKAHPLRALCHAHDHITMTLQLREQYAVRGSPRYQLAGGPGSRSSDRLSTLAR